MESKTNELKIQILIQWITPESKLSPQKTSFKPNFTHICEV